MKGTEKERNTPFDPFRPWTIIIIIALVRSHSLHPYDSGNLLFVNIPSSLYVLIVADLTTRCVKCVYE